MSLRPIRCRPQLEQLEGRCLPSADPIASIAGIIPNDTYFNELYGLNNTGQEVGSPAGFSYTGTADADIDAPEAWQWFVDNEKTVGSTSVVVGVVDTGMDYTHPDLYLNVWINQEEIPGYEADGTPTPGSVLSRLVDTDDDGRITFWDLNYWDPITRTYPNQGKGKITDLNRNRRIDAGDILQPVKKGGWADGIDADPFTTNGTYYSYKDDLVGWDWANNDNNPLDDNGHGTHVSGTIGAVGNNGTGVTGVVWKTQMAALKFMNRFGYGSVSNAARAIDYAVGNGMRVTNHSWGVSQDSATLEAAVANAALANHIIVAAAGNSTSDNDATPVYPASYNLGNVIVVAATDNNDNLASFSNYGSTTVDIAAPGVNIASTIPGGYAFGSGTSMAAPHVTGAIALLLARDSTPTTAEQIIDRLTSTADILDSLDGEGGLNPAVSSGGRLNLYNALNNITSGSGGGSSSGNQSGDGDGTGGILSWETTAIDVGPTRDSRGNSTSLVVAILSEPDRRTEASPAARTPRREEVEEELAASDALFGEAGEAEDAEPLVERLADTDEAEPVVAILDELAEVLAV